MHVQTHPSTPMQDFWLLEAISWSRAGLALVLHSVHHSSQVTHHTLITC